MFILFINKSPLLERRWPHQEDFVKIETSETPYCKVGYLAQGYSLENQGFCNFFRMNRIRDICGNIFNLKKSVAKAHRLVVEHMISHDKIISLHDNACRNVAMPVFGNTKLGSHALPVVFTRHFFFRFSLVLNDDTWPV